MVRSKIRSFLRWTLDQLGDESPKAVTAELAQVYIRLGSLEGKVSVLLALVFLTLSTILGAVATNLLG